MKALICGVGGQDGAYLAKLLLEKGYEVSGTSRDAQITNFRNLQLSQEATRVRITQHPDTQHSLRH